MIKTFLIYITFCQEQVGVPERREVWLFYKCLMYKALTYLLFESMTLWTPVIQYNIQSKNVCHFYYNEKY